MSTKKLQILNSIVKNAENADTLDGKHASEFVLASDFEQPDWNAAEGEPGHIINRTHWVEINLVEVLPECQPVFDEGEGSFLVMGEVSLTIGAEYTVRWNGVDYNCVAKNVNLDGLNIPGLGNLAAVGFGEETTDPFIVVALPVELTGGIGAQIIPLDGTADLTISILSEGEIVHKLDNKYLDAEWMATSIKASAIVEYASYEHNSSVRVDSSMLSDGKEIIIEYEGNLYNKTIGLLEGGIMCVGNLAIISPDNFVNTGEPFCITCVGSDLGIAFADGNSHYIGLYDPEGEGKIYSKMPIEFLPKIPIDLMPEHTHGCDQSLDVTSNNPIANKVVSEEISKLNTKLIEHKHTIEDIEKFAGKTVAGTTYIIDGTSMTAGSGAEVFNNYAHNIAIGSYSHAEGFYTDATGEKSHAEGGSTTASGYCSHAEGEATTASSNSSHAEGRSTTATANYSHAEGKGTTASGIMSHAEGGDTTASGQASHAEGEGTTASGHWSHAEGYFTIASMAYQHVQGEYNIEDRNGVYSHIVGNGRADDARSNAHTIDWDGNANFAGDVYVSNANENKAGKKLATEEYVDSKVSASGGGVTDEQIASAVKAYMAENPVIPVITTEPTEDDIPKVFITGVKPTTKDDALAEMYYISKTERFHTYLKIKCQGASSMSYAKKNFTIKMYSDEARETKCKKSFKDWNHEGNKFVLKANWIDHSHARNIVSARLWDEIVKSRSNYDTLPEEMRNSPNSGAIDGFPVKLYYNGTYEGIYTWNIGKDDWMWGMDEDNPKHVLLCCSYNDNGVLLNKAGNFRALWSGVHEDNWDIEVGTQSTALTNSLNALISCVKDTDDATFKATIGNYLDINSALDYYLYFWANAGLDSLENNLLLATYDGVKWICGAYDMDSVWGLWWDGSKFISTNFKCPDEYQAQYSLLWERITKLFVPELKARYAELRSGVLSYPNIVTHFERFMDVIGSELYAEDLTIYTGIPSGSTNNIKQIRDYVRDRLTYVDTEVGNMSEEPDVPDIPDEPEVDEGLIYSLPEPTTFNGVDTFVDTGVKLFDTAKDFTIVASGDFSQEQTAGMVTPTMLHCVHEAGNWEGLGLTWNNHNAPAAASLYQFTSSRNNILV